MGAILLRIRTWWETADRTQRVVSIFGGVFLVLLLAGTFYFSTRPNMVLAYGGLSQADTGKTVAEIQKLGIPVEYDTQGNIKVPEDALPQVLATLADKGVAPTAGGANSSSLDGIGMITSNAVEQAKLNAFREEQVQKTLEGLANVQTARVLLNPGERATFASEDVNPSASVTITPKGGMDISPDEAKAMSGLVARAIPGLKQTDITIVSVDGTMLYDGASETGTAASSTNKISAQIAEARRIRNELQPILDRWAGSGRTFLTARVTMDWDETKVKETKVKPTGVLSKEQISEQVNGKKSTTGTINTDANNQPGQTTTQNEKGDSYVGLQSSEEYGYDRTETEKVKAPGTVTSIALSVVVNDSEIKPAAGQTAVPVPTKQDVENFLYGHLGYIQKDGVWSSPVESEDAPTYTVQVVQSKFQPTDTSAVKKAESAAQMQQYFSLIPILALIFVAFMVVKSMGKVAKSSNVMVTAGAGGQLVAGGRSVALNGGSNDANLSRALQAFNESEEETEQYIEYEEDDEQGNKVKKRRKAKVGEIDEKLDIPLEQIRKMAKDRPETVAMLLKSWLVEERR